VCGHWASNTLYGTLGVNQDTWNIGSGGGACGPQPSINLHSKLERLVSTNWSFDLLYRQRLVAAFSSPSATVSRLRPLIQAQARYRTLTPSPPESFFELALMDPSGIIPMSVDISSTYGALVLGNMLAIGFWFLQCFQTYVDYAFGIIHSFTKHCTQGLLFSPVCTRDQSICHKLNGPSDP
jgi:hypothetical protein